jgi:hypothetical protein
VFARSKRPVIAHAAFALHFYAFLLLLLSVGTVVPAVDVWFGGIGLASEGFDHVLSIGLVAVSALYLYLAAGRVYGARGVSRAAQTLALTVGVVVIVLGYRFALLVITLYST